ncbi:MAG TPA: 3-deoxy-7-phosphoheptulonate synthase [Armatimonadetes bacterium]|jgi:3-deoxy-7-phosphoheptulonate synthase|nr:3-deoxy-7-phosphoheptulonate synthase [Armatimonadota bacterium]
MIIILSSNATDQDVDKVVTNLKGRGYGIHLSRGVEKTIIGAIGAPDEDKADIAQRIEALPFVERVVSILKPYKLVGREFHPERTVINVRGVTIGGDEIVVMAGPCCVESEEQLLTTARAARKAGARVLRGGAFKPSTSPYSFQGLGEEALKYMAAARDETGMPIITEVMDARDIDLVLKYSDILQVGARNMANFSLLKEIGLARKPVMLKRGLSSTIEEWLQAAEYIASRGNYDIILCERGIRTFETYTRNTFDINAIPAVKGLAHLPVIADTSHGTGRWHLVEPVGRAAIAAGADGLMIEVHPNPEVALKDGPQSLKIDTFERLMRGLIPIIEAVGRTPGWSA